MFWNHQIEAFRSFTQAYLCATVLYIGIRRPILEFSRAAALSQERGDVADAAGGSTFRVERIAGTKAAQDALNAYFLSVKSIRAGSCHLFEQRETVHQEPGKFSEKAGFEENREAVRTN